jgi:wyosine [tRNA(Phe)-imidazoG37] synthetase (radical SAM superfamily)
MNTSRNLNCQNESIQSLQEDLKNLRARAVEVNSIWRTAKNEDVQPVMQKELQILRAIEEKESALREIEKAEAMRAMKDDEDMLAEVLPALHRVRVAEGKRYKKAHEDRLYQDMMRALSA